MNIVVLVKQVPDTGAERSLRQSDSTIDRDTGSPVINEVDEYAIEEGLRLAEAHGGEVTVVSMGPAQAADAIRRALSMGAAKAVHVSDEALRGSDGLVTSAVLAAVLKRTGFDLVLLGSESTDARMGTLAAMLAERLRVPQMSFASQVVADGGAITIRRQADYGYDTLEAAMPAVVSVVEKINEPRYPTFKGIMAAKKKPIETIGLADLDFDPGLAGQGASATEVVSFAVRPPRAAGTVVTDEGDGGTRAAGFLQARRFV